MVIVEAPRDVIALMKRWSARWPRDRTVTLIDVGAQIDVNVLAMNNLAQEAGLPFRADFNDIRPADITDTLGAHSYDYAHVGESLGKMPEIEQLTTLRAAERLARNGLVWTGFTRTPLSGAGMKRSQIFKLRRRLSMPWLTKRACPRMGGAFLFAQEFPDAWTGLGDTARAG